MANGNTPDGQLLDLDASRSDSWAGGALRIVAQRHVKAMQDEHGSDPDGNDEAPGSLGDVFERPSAAHSEGHLYAPPRTVPPTSDHRTIEIETVKVRKDPQRAAVTQPSIRRNAEQQARAAQEAQAEQARAEQAAQAAQAEQVEQPAAQAEPDAGPDSAYPVPDSTYPVIAGERSRGSSAVWLVAIGALVALVAVAIVLARGSSATPADSGTVAAPIPSAAAPTGSAAIVAAPSTAPSAPAAAVASTEPAPATSAQPTPATAVPARPAAHPAAHDKPGAPPAAPKASAKPKYQPLF